MRPILTAVVAAIEAIAVAIAGLAVVAIPALLLWSVTFGLAAEPGEVATDAAAVWLLGHFVPLSLSLSADTAVALGLASAPLTFSLSLVPLGITLVTVLLAIRSGWRFARRGGIGGAGVIGGALGFALVASMVVPVAHARIAWPNGSAILVPALVYGCASGAAFLVRAARDDHDWWAATLRWKQHQLTRLGVPGVAALPVRLAEMIRLAAALLAATLGLAALGLTVAIIAGYVSITTLSQNLQLDGVGALLLFLLQLAYLPTMLMWSVSWLSGAGFAVGIGSSASPFGALLGPMPALPMFGAIPQGWGSSGTIAPALLALVGFGIGVLFAGRAEIRRATWTVALVIPFAAVVCVGFAVTALTAFATGSIGPDRLASVGPSPWLVGGLVVLELGVGVLLGVAARKIDYSRLRAVLPDFSERSELSELSELSEQPERISVRDAVRRQRGAVLASEAHGIDEYETVELSETRDLSEVRDPETLDTEAYDVEPEHVAPRDPELFDQESVDIELDDPEPDPAPGDPESGDPAPAQEPADDQVTEELLRAYSWDAAQLEDVDEDRKGWPWQGKAR